MGKETKDTKFIKQLCLLTLVVIAMSVVLRKSLTVWWPAVTCFFFIVSITVYFFSEKAKKKDMRRFVNLYMALTVVKMVLYLAIILVYTLNFREDGKRFAITFLAYYLIYTVFETIKLAKKDKNLSDGKQ